MSGLEREVHRGMNQLSVVKMFLNGLEELETLNSKGEFANSHIDRVLKAVNGLEETLKGILKLYGRGK